MSTTSTVDESAAALEAGLAFRLGRAHRIVRSGWQARIADLGLSSAQASTLRAVLERPGAGLRELSRTLGTDPMNAKRLADGLEADGLLESRVDPLDRRLRLLFPTDRGRQAGAEIVRRALDWADTLNRIIGADDAAAVLRTLDRLERGVAALAAPETSSEAPASRDATVATTPRKRKAGSDG
jgi:DNA-binding MarR family transcriptional regulator